MSYISQTKHSNQFKQPLAATKENSDSDDMDEKEESKDIFDDSPDTFMIMIKSKNYEIDKTKLNNAKLEQDEWKNYFDKMEYLKDGTSIYIAGNLEPAFVFMHGAGYSSLSFACLAQEIKKFATAIAFDFRGHGAHLKTEDSSDLSVDTLINDAFEVFEQIITIFPKHMFVICGHSMGGAIATKFTKKALDQSNFKDRITGLIVIDIVEGSALQSIPAMKNAIQQRPQSFQSITEAIKWNLKTGTIKNYQSAKISVPSQLSEIKNEKDKVIGYQWKVDLILSQKYWIGWFVGLTKSFLSIQVPKILILANRDSLDLDLVFAQNQGKFKLCAFENTGHVVHEDNPLQMAKTCYMLLTRFNLPKNIEEAKLIKELGSWEYKPVQNPYQNFEKY